MNYFLYEITQCYEVERKIVEQGTQPIKKRKAKTAEDLEKEVSTIKELKP